MTEQQQGEGLLSKLEKPWYALLDALEAKGVPVYRVVDPIDEHVPSVLVAILVLLLLLGGIAFLLIGGGTANITLKVTADGKPLPGVSVAVSGNGVELEQTTGREGSTELSLVKGKYELNLTREHCDSRSAELDVKKSGEREFEMSCRTSALFGGCAELPETLDTARVVGEDNVEPSNCVLTATSGGVPVETGWAIDGNNRLIFGKGKCIQDNYSILIQCDRHSRQASAKEIIQEAMVDGEVVVYASGAAKGLEAGTVYNVYVTVTGESGQPLENMRVVAVDSMGNEYITGYRNTKTTDVTNVDGQAMLQMAAGLEFYVRAEDPNGEYAPAVSKLLRADDAIELELQMKKGLQSGISVTQKGGGGIANAPVVVKRGNVTLISENADGSGNLTVALEEGKYTAESAPPGYVPAAKGFKAGEDVALELEPVSEKDQGIIKITAVAPDGVPLRDVRVLLGFNGVTAGDCLTTQSGKCVFEKMAPGTYSIAAVAPATAEEQEFGTVELAAGGLVEKEITIAPKMFAVHVRAKTATKFLSKATVTMLSRSTEEELNSSITGSDGKAEFSAYLGQSIYFKGSHAGYPDATSTTVLVTGETAETLLFIKAGEVGSGWIAVTKDEKLRLLLPESILPGGKAKATLMTAVSKDKGYKSTTLEIWLGKEGSIENPVKTPVEIGEMQAKPGDTLEMGGSYIGGKASLLEKPGNGKYALYSTGGGSQSVDIPLVAKADATAKSTEVHYRVKWETEGGDIVQSSWLSAELPIGAVSGWAKVANAYFSSYQAGFGAIDAPEGVWKKHASLVPGEVTYLHVIARAKKSSTMASIPIAAIPSGHLALTGYVLNGKSQQLKPRIPQTIRISSKVKEGGEVRLAIGIMASTAAKDIGVRLFNDRNSPLTITVDGSQKERRTPIANVTAVVVPQAKVCPPNGYEGKCQWGEFSADGLLGSLGSHSKREIRVKIVFKNNATEARKVSMSVAATGISQLGYDRNISVPAKGSKTAVITGVGEVPGKIRIRLGCYNWLTIRHGVTDYSIRAEGLISGSAEVRVMPLRNGALIPGAEVSVDGKALVNGGKYYTSRGMKLILGSHANISVKYKEFGELSKEENVSGIFFVPEERDNKKPTLLISSYNHQVSKKIVTVENREGKQAAVSVLPSFDEKYANISTDIVILDSQGNEMSSSKIPANGKAEVYLIATPKSDECNQRVSKNSLKITATAPGIRKEATYFADVSCDITAGGTGDWVVFRESGEIGRESCEIVGNTAYVCDAEQLSKALLKAAENLYSSGKESEVHTYAFGNDFVNAKVMGEVAARMQLKYPSKIGETGDNSLAIPDIGCGIIHAKIVKGQQGRETLSITKDDAPWCKPGSPYYFAGAMNLDSGIASAKDQLKTMAASSESERKEFLGAPLPTDDEAVFTVEYKGLKGTSSLAFNKYRWLTAKKKLFYAGTGYFHATPIRSGADFFIGTVGKPSPCFLQNLENYWTTGANSYISNSLMGDTVIADLSKCHAPAPVEVPKASVSISDSKGSDVHTTSDDKVTVTVDSGGEGCITVMEDRTGHELKKWEGKSFEAQLPGEGFLLFKSSCKKDAYPRWATTYLVKDSTPPSIGLPILTATSNDTLEFVAEATDDYGVQSCELSVDELGTVSKCSPRGDSGWVCSQSGLHEKLPKDIYSLLHFNVSCTDSNLNTATAGGVVYYYPPGVKPNIAINATASGLVYVEPYYYTPNQDVSLVFTASSETGITGCSANDSSGQWKDCSLVQCNEKSGDRCLNATYRCEQMAMGHEGHNSEEAVVCNEMAAEEEKAQTTEFQPLFIWDKEAPEITDIEASPYDVTNCSFTGVPTVSFSLQDSWTDDQDLSSNRTVCDVSILAKDGSVLYSITGAHPLETSHGGSQGQVTGMHEYAIAMKLAKGVGDSGKTTASPQNIQVNCSTTLYSSEGEGDMGINLAGKVESSNWGLVSQSQLHGPNLPIYMLPPGAAEAGDMLTKLGEYCYNHAYNIAPGKDDTQACFRVSPELLDGPVNAPASLSLQDKGPVVKRGSKIGGSPSADDLYLKGPYNKDSGMLLMWFGDKGWRQDDYSRSHDERHENDLHLDNAFSSGSNWGAGQDEITSADAVKDNSNCAAITSFPTPASPASGDPNYNPDSDDWIVPRLQSMAINRNEIYRECSRNDVAPDGPTEATVTCTATDAEKDELNYWVYTPNKAKGAEKLGFTPLKQAYSQNSSSLWDELAADNYFSVTGGDYAAVSTGNMNVTAESGMDWGGQGDAAYTLHCKATDQDWNETPQNKNVQLRVKNSNPQVIRVWTDDSSKMYWGDTKKIKCEAVDCEDSGNSLNVIISYRNENGGSTWNQLDTTYDGGDTFNATFTAPLPPKGASSSSGYAGNFDFKCEVTDTDKGVGSGIGEGIAYVHDVGSVKIYDPEPEPDVYDDDKLMMYTGDSIDFNANVYDEDGNTMSCVPLDYLGFSATNGLAKVDGSNSAFKSSYEESGEGTATVTVSLFGKSDGIRVKLRKRNIYATFYPLLWDQCHCPGGEGGGINYLPYNFTWPLHDDKIYGTGGEDSAHGIDNKDITGCTDDNCKYLCSPGGWVGTCNNKTTYGYPPSNFKGPSTVSYGGWWAYWLNMSGGSFTIPRNNSTGAEFYNDGGIPLTPGNTYVVDVSGSIYAWGISENPSLITDMRKFRSVYGSAIVGGRTRPWKSDSDPEDSDGYAFVKMNIHGGEGRPNADEFTLGGWDQKYDPTETKNRTGLLLPSQLDGKRHYYCAKDIPHGTSENTVFEDQHPFTYRLNDVLQWEYNKHSKWRSCSLEPNNANMDFIGKNENCRDSGSSPCTNVYEPGEPGSYTNLRNECTNNQDPFDNTPIRKCCQDCPAHHGAHDNKCTCQPLWTFGDANLRVDEIQIADKTCGANPDKTVRNEEECRADSYCKWDQAAGECVRKCASEVPLAETSVDRHNVYAETSHKLNCETSGTTATFQTSLSHDNDYQDTATDYLDLSVHYMDGTDGSVHLTNIDNVTCSNSPKSLSYSLTGIDPGKMVDYFSYHYRGWHGGDAYGVGCMGPPVADSSLFSFNSGKVET